MKKIILLILLTSCEPEDMRFFISNTNNTETPIVSIPTIAETDQDVFGNETPYFSYRLGGYEQNSDCIVASATAFFNEDNSDGKASDIVMKRSFDGGVTWQDRIVVVSNNGITTNSRVYNESFVIDKTNNRLWMMYVSIDTEGNLTASYPNPSYITDTLVCYSDNWDNPLETPTFSTPISLLSTFKTQLTDYATTDMVLPGAGNGIQTANGNLVFFGYSMMNNDGVNWRQNPMLITSTDNGVNWHCDNQPTGTFANESNGYEDGDNIVYINTRWGSGQPRVERVTNDFGVTYTTPSYYGSLIGLGCFGGVAKIPANGTTRTNDLFLYSNVTSNTPSRNSIRVDASINRVNYTNDVLYLTDYVSTGYSNIIYDGNYLMAMYESADGNIGAVNITEKIQDFYDAAVLVVP